MVKLLFYFKENEPTIQPKKRTLSQGPSKEWEFRSCVKKVNIQNDQDHRIESKKIIWPQTYTQNKPLAQRKHHFEEKGKLSQRNTEQRKGKRYETYCKRRIKIFN